MYLGIHWPKCVCMCGVFHWIFPAWKYPHISSIYFGQNACRRWMERMRLRYVILKLCGGQIDTQQLRFTLIGLLFSALHLESENSVELDLARPLNSVHIICWPKMHTNRIIVLDFVGWCTRMFHLYHSFRWCFRRAIQRGKHSLTISDIRHEHISLPCMPYDTNTGLFAQFHME